MVSVGLNFLEQFDGKIELWIIGPLELSVESQYGT